MLWQIFNSLGRNNAGKPAASLSQQELQAWQANHGVRLTAWELDTLIALDHVAAQVAAQHHHQAHP